MTAAVETMAFTNEVPWHGLGHRVDNKQTVAGMLKAAGLAWGVEKLPIGILDSNGNKASDAIDGFFALTRSTDTQVLDIVGRQYTPVQNEQAFEFFKEFVEAGKATMETAGSLRGGRLVWGLANLNASFKLRGGDEVKGYLLCGCPHQQGKALLYQFTSVRVVCQNTFRMALSSSGKVKDGEGQVLPEFRRSHRSEFNAAAVEQAKNVLGIARDQLHQFEEVARKLQAKKMTRAKTLEVLCPIFAAKVKIRDIVADFDKNATANLVKVMLANEKAPGAQPENAWGVFNSVTYWADHVASRTADKRLTNAWVGKTAAMKDRVLDALLRV
jgi:phage/plasmid-like protein (TIGR03299 family)